MANTNSNLATAHAAALTNGRAPMDPLDSGALPIYIRGRVTVPATPTVNDTLTLVPGELIPDGSVFAPELSWMHPLTGPGTGITFDVGPTSNPDALADSLPFTAAGAKRFDVSATVPLALSSRVAHVGGEDISATVMASTAVVATEFEFCIAYYANA